MNGKTRTLCIIPTTSVLSYKNVNGESRKQLLRSNEEYAFVLADGSTIFSTVNGIRTNKDGEIEVNLACELIAGAMNVISYSKRSILVDDIRDVYIVISSYARADTKGRQKTYDDVNSFTFSFNIAKSGGKYLITIPENEFTCVIVQDDNGNTRKLFGSIRDVDYDNGVIYFRRYISIKGTRSIHDEEIQADVINGIYPYILNIESKSDYEARQADAENAKDQNTFEGITGPGPSQDIQDSGKTSKASKKKKYATDDDTVKGAVATE